MTVIAASRRTMAGDTRSIHDGNVVGEYRKVHVVRDMVVGYAGCGDSGIMFFEWCKRGMNSRGKPRDLSEDFTGLVLNASGLYEYKYQLVPMRIDRDFWSIGTGAQAALGAMHMGASPEEAVEVACKIDPWSAGPVLAEGLPE